MHCRTETAIIRILSVFHKGKMIVFNKTVGKNFVAKGLLLVENKRLY